MELEHMKPVFFECARDSYSYFYFRVDKPSVVKVNTWPLDDKSDPDLYIGVDMDVVDQNSFTYKSNSIGADQVFMLPDNPKFKCGLWKIAIHAFN